ncbi:MAG: lipase class 2 [Nocardioidaceae bacterium]|nr:lipase class 2 [Nocardioidaceae bacterium]
MLALAALTGAGLLLVLTVVVGRATDSVDAVAQDERGPILLVPGYGGNGGSLTDLAVGLRAGGRDVEIVDLGGDGRGDLDEQAQALAAAVTAALERTGAPSVDVVGYSAGGVVARLWVRSHGGAEQARRVVTLGSPHHGTDLAEVAGGTLGCPIACQQLATDSELLNRLNAGDETPEGPVFVSVWTADDETVTPPESAELDGALNIGVQSICAGAEVSHGDLPDAPVVRSLVELALAADEPVAAPARCPSG